MNRKKLPKTFLLPHGAILLSALIWGVAGPITKLALNDIPVFTFLLFRFLLVGLLVLPYLAYELTKDPVKKEDIPGIVLLGIAGQASIALIFIALKFTSALDVALIGSIGPILVFLAGRYFYHEKITKLEIFGMSLAFLGTLYIVLGPILGQKFSITGGERMIGNIFVILYNLSWPVYIILGKQLVGKDSKELNSIFKKFGIKKLSKDYKPATITALSFFVGLAFFIPAAAVEATTTNYYPVFTTNALIGITYMALLSSIVAYGVYQWGLKYLEAQETAVYSYLGLLFNIPAAFLILGEIPTQQMAVGVVVIAVGVVIAEKFKS